MVDHQRPAGNHEFFFLSIVRIRTRYVSRVLIVIVLAVVASIAPDDPPDDLPPSFYVCSLPLLHARHERTTIHCVL